MNSPTRRNEIAADLNLPEVPFQDRFARTSGRPPRTQPLMRRIEAASLLPNHTIQFSTHNVPRTGVFERIAGGFARGALVSTPNGEVAVEDLMPGDTVDSSEGVQRVQWIGSTQFSAAHMSDSDAGPGLLRVMPDSFGMARPASDVLLGPWAALLHTPPATGDGRGGTPVFAPVSDFIDGTNVFVVTPPSAVQVYHVVLEHHAALQVNGLPVESYHPGIGVVERLGENGQRLFLSLFAHLQEISAFGPLAFPQVSQDGWNGMSAA